MYKASPTIKICFIINKKIETICWSCKQYNLNVAVLCLQVEEQELIIINTYNPRRRDANRKIQAWKQIDKAFQDTTGEIILLKDFNYHYPQWKELTAVTELKADQLL